MTDETKESQDREIAAQVTRNLLLVYQAALDKIASGDYDIWEVEEIANEALGRIVPKRKKILL